MAMLNNQRVTLNTQQLDTDFQDFDRYSYGFINHDHENPFVSPWRWPHVQLASDKDKNCQHHKYDCMTLQDIDKVDKSVRHSGKPNQQCELFGSFWQYKHVINKRLSFGLKPWYRHNLNTKSHKELSQG